MIYNFIKGIGSWSSDTLTAKLALGMSILTIALVVSMQNTPCISASSCVVGDSETFSGTLKINSGNNFGHTLSGTATADRTLTMPDVSGELLVGNFTGNANKIMQVNTGANAVEYGFVDPLTQIDITSGGTQTPLAGQLLQVNTGANALTFGNVGIANINDSGTAGQFLKSSGSALSFSKIDVTDSTQIDIGTGQSGQILSVNSTGTALEYGPLPASAGSFQATAAQNVVAGTVGLEANGQVRNITVQQNGVAQVNLSQASTGGSATNVGWMSSHYNSNIDGQIVVYKDYDSNNQSSCDTHFYVDVVVENSGVLSNWGRQCISNSWGTHQTNGYTQYSNPNPNTQSYQYSFDRYGLEHDDSVNEYVFVYIGGNGNNSNASDGQIWSVPIQINTSNNTLVVGTDSLLHDHHYCPNNGSCNSSQNQTYYPTSIDSNVYAQQTSDANRMWLFFKSYHGGYYSSSYVWFKSYTCNFSNSTSDSCSPYQNFARDLTTSNGTNYLKQNWYDSINPVVWWDNLGQTFIVTNRTALNNNDCRFVQMSISESANSGNNQYSANKYNFTHGSYGYTDDISGGTFDSSGSNYSCGYSGQRPIHVPEHDNYIWVLSSGGTGQIDNYFIQIKSDTTSNSGSLVNAPVLVSMGSLENLITDEICVNTPNEQCNTNLWNKNGDVHIDKSVSPYKYYWNNRGMQDRNLCTKDYQQSKCAEIYEWSFDSTTGILDSSTFKHYDYQNRDESYQNDQTKSLGIWKDNGSGIVFTLNAHSNQAIDSANNNLLHAIAFVIPDNISEYIGFVTQSANQGATVTVLSVGAVLELSGSNFTIGEEYYVQSDGSLSTSGTYKIGRAIATDKIYITDTR